MKPDENETLCHRSQPLRLKGLGNNLFFRTLSVGVGVVRDALHRSGKRLPDRVDDRRYRKRTAGQPAIPKSQQIAAIGLKQPQGRAIMKP